MVSDNANSSLSVADHLMLILRERNVLSEEQLATLKGVEFQSQGQIEKELSASYGVNPIEIFLALAQHANIPVLRLSSFMIREELLSKIPKDVLVRHRVCPVSVTRSTMTLAMADPLNVLAVQEIADITRLKVVPVAAAETEINEVLGASGKSSDDMMKDILEKAGESGVEVQQKKEAEDLDNQAGSGDDAPIIRLVNMLLVESIRKGASDIHIEPFEKEVRVRYRIDGNLIEQPSPPKAYQNAIISRVKVMSNLDIAERRIPQDGRFRIKAQGREIDLRVSILPVVHGEKICMRLLDKSKLAKDLGSIGLDPDSLVKLRFALAQPQGLILVTGPTGSGKTTTLYSALQELNTIDVNIVTTENPVEYQLFGINQVEINQATGMTFAAALRSILRQDPDIVLVGETRDAETAKIAAEAAATGHLVLTTLHTNDAPSAITRLSNMEVEKFLIAASLILSQAQRLVRRICANCKEPFPMNEEYATANRIPVDTFKDVEIYHGRGCAKCGGSGYKGRCSIMELMPISAGIRDVILRTDDTGEIRRVAITEGFRDMRQNGFYRVREGITTIEEVIGATSGEF